MYVYRVLVCCLNSSGDTLIHARRCASVWNELHDVVRKLIKRRMIRLFVGRSLHLYTFSFHSIIGETRAFPAHVDVSVESIHYAIVIYATVQYFCHYSNSTSYETNTFAVWRTSQPNHTQRYRKKQRQRQSRTE